MSDDFVVDDPVDPYAGDTESVLDDDAGEELPPYLADDPLAADTPDDEAPGVVAVEPAPSDVEEDLEPLPESWAELDPEAVDLPDADESEGTIADEVDAADDYDPLEIAPDEDEPEPEPVRWDAYEIQAREAGTISDFFQIALTDDPDAASVAVTTLEPGATYEIRIRGIKADGTTSGWSETETVVLPVDQIPPPQPSAPVVVGVPGGVVISHDGLTSTGDPQPTDYAQTVLWVRKGTGTPYIIDRFTGPFNVTYNSLDISPMAWWVTTVDQAGNSSVKSAEVNGQAQELIDEAGLRDKLDRLSTGEALVADSVAAYIGEYLHLKAAQLDANEIWANSAWLGQAKFESEVSGNRVLINSDGVQIGSTTTPAGITLDRNGFLLKNGDGSSTFALNGNTGDVSMYGATITAGQLRTAETGRRVTVDNNGITAYDSAGVIQSRFGSNAYNNSLAIRSPDGTLKEIGPHIYGSHSFSSYDTGTEVSFNKGTATAYGSYTGATWSQQFQTVSNRYRVDLSFLLYGFVESSGRTATFDFWLVPTDTAGTVLGGNFYRRELNLKNLIVEFPICYSTSIITTLPPSVAVGDTICLRWRGRAKNFYTNPRMSYLSAHLTPA